MVEPNDELIEKVPLSFLDVETTGLTPRFGDRICEVAVLRCHDGETRAFESLVNPKRPISPGASFVNEITDSMVEGAPLFDDIASKVLEFLEGAVIVCHNAPFDLGFLSRELELLNIEMVDNPVIDTLRLARKYYDFSSNSLGNIAKYLGISVDIKHRAMADVHITRAVLSRFLDDFAEQGITRLGQVLALQGAYRRAPRRRRPVALPPILEEAIQMNKDVWLRYVSQGGDVTERMVEPKEIVAYRDYLYLVAYCHLRQDERTFRLDRIINLR
ncbi:MAG: WYL domain-containing protein [Deltaproteobacteria bacterium]|nr:MAG: WYL domain-containing protein [Deltaproteobacteria bacterium]